MDLRNVNCIVRTADGKFITYHSVHGIPKFIRFIDHHFPGWLWFTAYEKGRLGHRENLRKEVYKNQDATTRYWATL